METKNQNTKLLLTKEGNWLHTKFIAEMRDCDDCSGNNCEVRLVGESQWIEVDSSLTDLFKMLSK